MQIRLTKTSIVLSLQLQLMLTLCRMLIVTCTIMQKGRFWFVLTQFVRRNESSMHPRMQQLIDSFIRIICFQQFFFLLYRKLDENGQLSFMEQETIKSDLLASFGKRSEHTMPTTSASTKQKTLHELYTCTSNTICIHIIALCAQHMMMYV